MELFKLTQILAAAFLMAAILMQNRGGGLSGIFGGGNGNIYLTKRGFEKKLFIATIVLSIVFFSVSFLTVIN